jgi:hypothetical protein
MSAQARWAAAASLSALAIWLGVRVLDPGDAPSIPRADAPAQQSTARAPAQAVTQRPQDPGKSRRHVAGGSLLGEQERGAQLVVHVVAMETGAPLANVALRCAPLADVSSFEDGPWVSTDELGRAAFAPAPQVALHLFARASSWEARDELREIAALAAGEVRTLELALQTREDLRIQGRVVDAATHAGLGGALIRLDDFASWSGSGGGFDAPGSAETKSAADGSFELGLRSWAPGVVRVRCAGFGMAMQSTALLSGDARAPWLVELETEAVLELALSGQTANHALRVRAGVESFQLLTQAGPWNFRWSPDPCFETSVDADGNARIGGWPAHVSFQLSVLEGERELLHASAARLASGETRRVELALKPSLRVEGEVRDGTGRTVANVELWALQASGFLERYFGLFDKPQFRTHTDEQGRFQFAELESGEWAIGPAPTPMFAASGTETPSTCVARAVTLAAGAPAERLDFVLAHGLYIRGRVHTEDGARVPAATVVASSLQGRGSVFVISDPLGAFSVGPLLEGEYSLAALGSLGSARASAPQFAIAGAENVLLVVSNGGSLRGRISWPENELPHSYWIAFQPRFPGGLPSSWSSTAPHAGEFLRDGLDPGRYTLIARTQAGWVGVLDEVEVESGRESALPLIQLSKSAELELRLEGESPMEIVELWRGEAFLGRCHLERGAQWLESLPTGALRIRHITTAGELLDVRECTLVLGNRTSVILDY